jgi:DNA-binding transcriptional MerR regulator
MNTEEVRVCLESRIVRPPRRRIGRSGGLWFNEEHVTRLRFVKQALLHGFSVGMIVKVVAAHSPMTCNDVYGLAVEQLDRLRHSLAYDDPMVVALEALMDGCTRTGTRHDCEILKTLEERASKAH